ERITPDPAIHAAERANALVVREGIPFREAYRRIGAELRGEAPQDDGASGRDAPARDGDAEHGP
ncbi:MAG: hypothetical protein EBS39_09895, partial [Gammaproteobacteria bacterium]|nr:hypothetical protein [Gammaproteobacteria bacterium]